MGEIKSALSREMATETTTDSVAVLLQMSILSPTSTTEVLSVAVFCYKPEIRRRSTTEMQTVADLLRKKLTVAVTVAGGPIDGDGGRLPREELRGKGTVLIWG